LRKRKPQETQALAFASSCQSWLPLLRPNFPICWRLRLLRENFTQQKQAPTNRNARSKQWQTMIGSCLRIQALAFLAVFVYATHATQAIAFEMKPGFTPATVVGVSKNSAFGSKVNRVHNCEVME